MKEEDMTWSEFGRWIWQHFLTRPRRVIAAIIVLSVSTIAMSPTLQHDVKNFIGQLLGLFIAGAFLVLILSVITGRTKIRK